MPKTTSKIDEHGNRTVATRFDEIWKLYHTRIAEVRAAKRNDYTGSESPLYNYEATANLMGWSVERLMLSRLHEKAVRLAILTQPDVTRMVVDETLEDTLVDIANIALLIATSLQLKGEVDEGLFTGDYRG